MVPVPQAGMAWRDPGYGAALVIALPLVAPLEAPRDGRRHRRSVPGAHLPGLQADVAIDSLGAIRLRRLRRQAMTGH